MRAALEDAEGATPVGAVTRWLAPEATHWIDRGDQVYDDSGFTARFGPEEWLDRPSGH